MIGPRTATCLPVPSVLTEADNVCAQLRCIMECCEVKLISTTQNIRQLWQSHSVIQVLVWIFHAGCTQRGGDYLPVKDNLVHCCVLNHDINTERFNTYADSYVAPLCQCASYLTGVDHL